MRVVLASNSPRRKELLHQIFDSFDVIKSDFNEEVVDEKNPEELVKVLSSKKAEEVFDKIESNESELLVIGGDTLVYFDGQVLGKPKDEKDAYNTLKKLQGNENEVYSAFTVILKKYSKLIKETVLSKSRVTMKAMADEEIEEYIKTGEPMDKAGSFSVQGIGNKFVDSIEGTYNSVIGLDIEKLKEELNNLELERVMKMKKIIITGASDGLGKAIARELKEHELILISRDELKLKELSEELNCKYYVCDLRDYVQINNVMSEIKDVDILINNAGIWLAGDIEENLFEQISNCIDVNTKAPIYMTKAVVPIMRKKKNGLIINVCSQSSFDNDAFSTVYNASKWAMRGFNRSIQQVLSKDNIKVTGFYPGFMQTEFFKKAGNDYDTSTGLEVEKVAKAIRFIIECDQDVIIPELGIKDIENY